MKKVNRFGGVGIHNVRNEEDWFAILQKYNVRILSSQVRSIELLCASILLQENEFVLMLDLDLLKNSYKDIPKLLADKLEKKLNIPIKCYKEDGIMFIHVNTEEPISFIGRVEYKLNEKGLVRFNKDEVPQSYIDQPLPLISRLKRRGLIIRLQISPLEYTFILLTKTKPKKQNQNIRYV
jgi:hypothetical protein